MKSNQNLLSLGQSLKERREDQGLSLRKISEWTKISVHILEAIEEAKAEELPAYTYLRGFILSYAKALGMDEKEVEKDLKALISPSELVYLPGVTSSPQETSLIEKDIRLTPIILAISILLVIAGILALSAFISSYQKESLNKEQGHKPLEELKKNLDKEDLDKKNLDKEDLDKKNLDKEKPLVSIDIKKPKTNVSNKEEEENLLPSNIDKKLDKEPEHLKTKELKKPLIKNRIKPILKPEKEKTQTLEVVVKAIGDVKVFYKLDSSPLKEVSLSEDQFEVLKASENIFIRTETSNLIYVFHNGKDMGLFGKGGKKEKYFYSGKKTKKN